VILVVDDEQHIRLIAEKALTRFGYQVRLASNGAEAVSMYVSHRAEIAAVLTDMAMPVMDGPALIVALKAINPAVLIIGSSGLDANGLVAKAVAAGVQSFVPKPYTAEALLKVLASLFDRAR
ncbi:MAG: response regulator, partial [Acidobacteriota bacterium]|nr:response regulator [Acidobacteriota bacterium]